MTATFAPRPIAQLIRSYKWRDGLVLSKMIEDDTQELARGLRRRDPNLVDSLIQQYQYRLFRYLIHLTGDRDRAEDFFQETWIRVLERGDQYDGTRKFEGWLFTIARNLVIDWRRKTRTQSLDELISPVDDAPAFEPATTLDSPLEFTIRKQSQTAMQLLLARVPAVYREVLVLRFQEDMKLEEIASVVGAPVATVKSRLYRGLETVRQLLPREES